MQGFDFGVKTDKRVTYHDPCDLGRHCGIYEEPRNTIRKIAPNFVEMPYNRENALCCGAILRAQQRDDLADDLQKRNLEDMKEAGANVCVFNCPFCLFTLGEAVAQQGMMPLLMSELCQYALGEGKMIGR